MRLLVTGGAGYIGSVVATTLLAGGHEVTVLDDLSTGHRDAVPEGAAFVHASLLDELALARAVLPGAFDAVLHFAASSLVGESVVAPERYYRNNVVGSLNLLDAMRHAGVRRLVFSSTAATYGEPDSVPITEDDPTRPTNPYGASKLAIDHMIGFESRAHGLAAASLRYFNVAGAVGRAGERHRIETHIIPITLQVAAGRRQHLTVYGEDYPTPDGTCVRDYIHVADLARAHVLALDAIRPGEHLVCNLGNGAGYSVREVVEAAVRVTGRAIPVVIGDRRPGDPAVLVASSTRAAARLGWQPELTALDDMIGDAWTFLRSRVDGG